MGQIELDYLYTENLIKLQEIDPGVYVDDVPVHLQAGPMLVFSDNGDWRHWHCQDAFGTGMTPEERNLELWQGLQDLEKQ
jgi:hypothetical protein